jgi:hypothetical protein
MDASLLTPVAGGFALGALTGALFYGSLWVGVALAIGGAPLAAAALQIARFAALALGLYAAVRLGALALLTAGAACLAARRAALWWAGV